VKFLVTGGAGFIASRFIQLLLEKEPEAQVVNLDKLAYSGDLTRLKPCESNSRYSFVEGNICDRDVLSQIMPGVDAVFHLAAESHVDRSLLEASVFFETNCVGTQTLLDESLRHHIQRFIHVSTDEVYGSREVGFFTEKDALNPTSPYSISKMASDLLALNFYKSRGLEVIVTRGSNTYGPFQYPEKVIPLFVSNLLRGEKVPLYGDGSNERDWMHVDDHCEGIYTAFKSGTPGEIYNIGAKHHLNNKALTQKILTILGKDESCIQQVADRPGHDWRYAIDTAKIETLGWKVTKDFDAAFKETIAWYKQNTDWLEGIREKCAEYQEFYNNQYGERLK